MRIGLVYQDALTPGGYPRDVRALAKALHELGCDVTLLADTRQHASISEAPKDLRVSPLGSLLRTPNRFDLLHVFGLFLPRHAVVLARHVAGAARVVVSPLSHLQPLAMERNRARKHFVLSVLAPLLSRLDTVHVFSETERESLQPWRALRERPSFIASLGVHDDGVPPATEPSETPPTVAFFGRNDVHQKGIDLAIRGFARFVEESNARDVSPRLVIAGMADAASETRLRELLRQENIGSSVDIVGSVTDEAKWRLLRDSSMLIFMSRFDGPPRPIREALSVGTPCIVSYESNMGELVERFGAGRAAPLQPAAVAGCLHEGFASPGTLDSWHAGSVGLRAELAWANVARGYLSGYESIGVTGTSATD